MLKSFLVEYDAGTVERRKAIVPRIVDDCMNAIVDHNARQYAAHGGQRAAHRVDLPDDGRLTKLLNDAADAGTPLHMVDTYTLPNQTDERADIIDDVFTNYEARWNAA